MQIWADLLAVVAVMVIASSVVAAKDDYWVTSPLHNVFKNSSAPAARETGVRIITARNQTENAQIVWTPTQELKSAHVEFEPLVSPTGDKIDPAAFDFNFIEYHFVEKNSTQTPKEFLLREAPADFPDGLLEERTLDIAPGRNWPVFLTFRVPKDSTPGVYTGKVFLVAEGERVPVDVSLEVVEVDFPDQTRLSLTMWMDVAAYAQHMNVPMWSDQFWASFKQLAKMMKAHHQNTTMFDRNSIKVTRGPDGKLVFDYSILDKWVEMLDSEGVGKYIEISHVGGRKENVWESQFIDYPMQMEEPGKKEKTQIPLEEWLPGLYKHLEEKGWVDRTLIHIADEPDSMNAESWNALSKRVRAAAPRLKRIEALNTPLVFDNVEIGVPILHSYTPEMQKAANEKGVTLWFYTAWIPQGQHPNRLMDFPAIKTRILHWINYRYALPGYLHWALEFWNVPFLQFAPGDCEIIWPGKNGPRSSIRLEALRSGVEDYELMSMLEDANVRVQKKLGAKLDVKQRSMELCTKILRHPTDYETSPTKMQSVREQLLHELAAIEQPPLLLVQTDPAEGSKAEKITVSGVVEKGATVTLNGKAVEVTDTGYFHDITSDKVLTIVAEKNGVRKVVVRVFH